MRPGQPCYCREVRRFAVVLTLGLGCRSTPQEAPRSATETVRRAATLEDALSHIDADSLRAHVTYLASDEMRGRPTPSAELDAAADYIDQTLAQSGIAPGPTGPRQRVRCGALGEPAENVLGLLRGTTDETVLVTAHYDHVGSNGTGDDTIYNGANDNASGVAAMLTVASALARAPSPLRRNVLFVAFCGEERGLKGSQGFVADPPVALANIVAVLNLEMLGHADPANPRRAWVTGHAYSDLASWLERAGAPEGVSFVPGTAIGPVEGAAFNRSDNYPFVEAGVVAHTVAAGPLDEHYHAVSDETQHIDFDAMVPIVRAIARATDALARDEAAPRWSASIPPTDRASGTSRP